MPRTRRRTRPPAARAPLREKLACSHAGGHLVGLGAVRAAVLELDRGQPLLARERHDLRPGALAVAVLDDLIRDALLIERPLHLPARVQTGVQERPRAAVELDARHRPASLRAR